MPLDGLRRTKGWADKYTIANTTDHMLQRRYDGYFDPLYLLMNTAEKFPAGLPHTFTDRRYAIVDGEEELIVNVFEHCRDMAYQL